MRRLLLENSVYEVLGYGVSQALRLGSNLVLTRLLFPEAFGIMVICNIVLFGLTMLSDVGIVQSVIQNRRGDDQDFLDTAWTLQAVRGAVLCGLTFAMAWPAAQFYEEPVLTGLLMVAGVQLLIAGFESTSFFTLRRRVESLKLAIIEIGVHAATILATVSIAYQWRSVWALVFGAFVGSVVRLVWSHAIRIGYRNHFAWDASVRAEILAFGRWIFGSSVASFLSTRADRLMLGRLLGMSILGVYSIALIVSEFTGGAVSKVVSGVFYPIFARVHNEDPARLAEEYDHARMRLDGVALPALGLLAMLGDFAIELLWDPRYAEGGWMLRILVIRVAIAAIILPCEACLVAIGESRFGFIRSVLLMLAIVIGVPLGYSIAGAEGLVWAVTLSEIPAIFVLWPAVARRGYFRVRREIFAVLLFGAGILLGSLIRYALTGAWT